MTKRVRVVMVAALAALMLLTGGCSSNKLSTSVKEAAGSAEPAGSGSGTVDSTQTAALNVENDGFTFEQLVVKAGAAEADVLSLIGANEKRDVYETTLFGEKTSIKLTVDQDKVSSIQLTFAGTNEDSLKNAISEQLAQDGESANGETQWIYEGSTVTLGSNDQGCEVKIVK